MRVVELVGKKTTQFFCSSSCYLREMVFVVRRNRRHHLNICSQGLQKFYFVLGGFVWAHKKASITSRSGHQTQPNASVSYWLYWQNSIYLLSLPLSNPQEEACLPFQPTQSCTSLSCQTNQTAIPGLSFTLPPGLRCSALA